MKSITKKLGIISMSLMLCMVVIRMQAQTWTQLIANGNTLSSPTMRYSPKAVYDPANNRMITFGGYMNYSYLNDVWVLSNANGLGGTPTWVKLSPNPDPTQTTNGYNGLPVIRADHTAIYDAANNRMTIFGGGIVAVVVI